MMIAKYTKKIIMYCICAALMTGCGISEPGSASVAETESSASDMQNVYEGGDSDMLSYSQVASIHITDALPGMFRDELDIYAGASDLEGIISAAEDLTFKNDIMMRKAWYSLELLDSNGKLVDVWTVDTYRTIQTTSGNKIKRTGQIDRALSELEKNCNITKKLFARVPGSNYFQSMKDVSMVNFQKIVETNFDDDLDLDLPDEMTSNLKEHLPEIQISDQKNESYEEKYVLTFYNNEGNTLYTFHIDNKNNVYTNAGYALTGIFIDEWISGVMEMALKE